MRNVLQGRKRWILTGISLVLLAVYLFPIYWMVATAVRSSTEIFAYPPDLIPTSFNWSIFGEVWGQSNVPRYFFNSVVVGVGTTLVSLGLSAPAAYGMAHLNVRGANYLQLGALASLMFPAVMLATPLFVVFANTGLTDSYSGLILANSALAMPFAVTVLRPFMRSIPNDLAEAARIDGCSRWSAFWRVILPLSKPGLFAASVFTFLLGWSNLVFALALTSEASMRPVTAGLWNFIGANVTEWNSVMAFSTLTMLPPLVVFLLAQRYIVSGLTSGSLK